MCPTNKKSLGLGIDSRLAGYAAVAGAALAVPAIADATVVYSGAINIPIVNNIDGLYINFVTGANANASVPGWDFNPYNSSGINFFTTTTAANNNQDVGVGTAITPLSAGALIGPASGYATAGVLSGAGTPWRTTQNTAYVGIRFTNEVTGIINYGWALLSTTAATGFPASLIGYAYENTGLAIMAGQQTDVPEPSTTALFGVIAAGAYGVRAWRKRKAA